MGTLILTKEARIYNGAKTASSKMVLGKLDSYMEKNEIRTLPNTMLLLLSRFSRVRLCATP